LLVVESCGAAAEYRGGWRTPSAVAATPGEYQRRYPSQTAGWQIGDAATSADVDLIFAYYPTPQELWDSLPLSAKHWLGFPAEFVADAWKQPIDPDASTRPSAYLDEGGIENGGRLLEYLYSLVRSGAPSPGAAERASGWNLSSRQRRSVFRFRWWQNSRSLRRCCRTTGGFSRPWRSR
jgi:hypothetical protein